MIPGSEITQLLQEMRRGNRTIAEQVLALLYKELHKLAESYI